MNKKKFCLYFADFRQVKIIGHFCRVWASQKFRQNSSTKCYRYISGHKTISYCILFKTTNPVTGYSVYNFLYYIYISVLTTIDLSQNDVADISDLL